MPHTTNRRTHDQERKRHRHEQEQHARAAARRPKSSLPVWLLAIGITLMLLFVIGGSVAR